LQNTESVRFSAPHLAQNFGIGFSSAGWPQREQNLALGGRFLPQLAHWEKTSC
jgi:hypothetical protein